MAAAAPIAIGMNLAGTALSAFGETEKARGQATAYQFQEAQAQRKAAAARTAADQTDAQLRENLTTTLANIGAIRAASGVDPTSPTTDAIMQNETRIGDWARMIRVRNLQAQADADEDSAHYFAYAADKALDAGTISTIGTVIKGIGGAAGSLSGWSGGASVAHA